MAMLTRYGIPAMLLIGLCSVVYVWFSASSTTEPKTGLKTYAVGDLKSLQIRAEPPIQSDAELLGPDESMLTLADYQGRILVVNFWGTFCAPCIVEMPTLAALQDRYDENDLKVMAISVDRVGDFPLARKQLADLTDDRLEFFADPTRGVLFDSLVAGFPTTLIYGEDGSELARLEGEADWASDDAFSFFDALVSQASE